jgi:hypothetical protein
MSNTYKQVLARKRKLLEEAPTKARNAAAIAFVARVVPRTPVDTGQARGNWQAGVGQPDTTTDPTSLDPNATKTPQRLKRVIKALPKGGSLFISNHLPYARRLENGWSQQAPSGFMTLTAAEVAYLAPAFLMAALGAKPTATGFVTFELED